MTEIKQRIKVLTLGDGQQIIEGGQLYGHTVAIIIEDSPWFEVFSMNPDKKTLSPIGKFHAEHARIASIEYYPPETEKPAEEKPADPPKKAKGTRAERKRKRQEGKA